MRAHQCGILRVQQQARLAAGFRHLFQRHIDHIENAFRTRGKFARHHLARHVERQFKHHVGQAKIEVVEGGAEAFSQLFHATAGLFAFHPPGGQSFGVALGTRGFAQPGELSLGIHGGRRLPASRRSEFHHFPVLKCGGVVVGAHAASSSSGNRIAPSAASRRKVAPHSSCAA